MVSWSDGHAVSSHWLKTLDEWHRTHLRPQIETSKEIKDTEDSDGSESNELDISDFPLVEDDN